jgi:hypothetical protein
MDRLIIAYNNAEGTVTRSNFVGMRIADESEAEGIEAEFKAQYPEAVTYISDSADDIDILREAQRYIGGWDIEYNRFILNGTLLTVKRHIVTKRLNAIDREYRTPRTLADAIAGDTWAITRLAEAEALCAPIRAELAELSEPESPEEPTDE